MWGLFIAVFGVPQQHGAKYVLGVAWKKVAWKKEAVAKNRTEISALVQKFWGSLGAPRGSKIALSSLLGRFLTPW